MGIYGKSTDWGKSHITIRQNYIQNSPKSYSDMTQKFAQPAEGEFRGSIPIICKENKLVKTLSTCLTLTKEWWNGYHIKKNDGCQSWF